MSFGKFTLKELFEKSALIAIRINNDDEWKRVGKELYKMEAKWDNGSPLLLNIFIPVEYPVLITTGGRVITQLYALQNNFYVVDVDEIEFELDKNINTLITERITSMTDSKKELMLKFCNLLESNSLYYINPDGNVDALNTTDVEVMLAYLSSYNLFKTKDEAVFEAKRQQLLHRYKEASIKSGEENNPWDLSHKHYFAFWSPRYNRLMIMDTCALRGHFVYFPSYKACRDAVNSIGVPHFIKYILGVEYVSNQ